MNNYKVIFFDLDGTLTDPKEGITKSVQYALAKMGIVEAELENSEATYLIDSVKELMDFFVSEKI